MITRTYATAKWVRRGILLYTAFVGFTALNYIWKGQYFWGSVQLLTFAVSFYAINLWNEIVWSYGWRPPLPYLRRLQATVTYVGSPMAVSGGQKSTGTP